MATKSESPLNRMYRDLLRHEQARKTLNEPANLSPVVMWENIALKAFDAWLEKYDEGENLRWNYQPKATDTGRVVVYEISRAVHGATAQNIFYQISKQLTFAGGNKDAQVGSARNETYCRQGSRTLAIGGMHRFKPDGSLRPRDASRNSHPTLVVEVAFSLESIALEDKMLKYLDDPTIQVIIGVKIPYFYGTYREEGNREFHMLQSIDEEDVVGYHVDFGQGVAPPTNPPSFAVQCMYVGTPIPAEIVGLENNLIVIDLEALDAYIDINSDDI